MDKEIIVKFTKISCTGKVESKKMLLCNSDSVVCDGHVECECDCQSLTLTLSVSLSVTVTAELPS